MPDAENMPKDLQAVLSDPGIVIRQDAAVFDLIARWNRAPSATAAANPTVTYDTNLLEQLAQQAKSTRAATGIGCQ